MRQTSGWVLALAIAAGAPGVRADEPGPSAPPPPPPPVRQANDAEHPAEASGPRLGDGWQRPRQGGTHRPLMGLGIAGAVILGASWIASSASVVLTTSCHQEPKPDARCAPFDFFCSKTTTVCHSYSGFLFIPVLGPVVAGATMGSRGDLVPGESAWYIGASVVNVAALVGMVAGFAYRSPVTLAGAPIRIAPLPVRAGAGLALTLDL